MFEVLIRPAGKGDSDMAAYLTSPPANLAAKAAQSKTDAQLRRSILEGRPGTAMSSYDGAFEESQLVDLLAYIRSLKQQGQVPLSKWASGRPLGLSARRNFCSHI